MLGRKIAIGRLIRFLRLGDAIGGGQARHAGLQPDRLVNLKLRVRGFIEERSGPRIEATRPEQIEIAESK